MSYNVKNYTEPGGEKTVINGEIVINGKLIVNENAEVNGVEKSPYTIPIASSTSIGGVKEALNVPESEATTVATLKSNFNNLLIKLKDAGVIGKDAFNISVITIPTPVGTDLIANHEKVDSIILVDNLITIKVPVDELVAFDSNNPNQGVHKWLGLSISTGLTSIIDVVYNGTYTLAQVDVDEATTVGCPLGSFVLWIKCDEINETPKVITLGRPGYETVTLTITIEDM